MAHTEELITFLKQYMTEERFQLFEAVVKQRTRYITVVLEDIYQPHNASAVLRSCDCFGVQDVHIIEERNTYSVNPEVSLGSSKWLHLHRYNQPEADNTAQCLEHLKAKGYDLVATSPHVSGHTPEDLPIDRPLAILLGTEGRGLTERTMQAADHHLRIPMYGFTESFNISVSAALILHRLTERLRVSDLDWRLDQEMQGPILLDWMRKSIRNSASLEEEFTTRQG
ncbi:MAG: RNA methyltransferase [Flavobacteriales bacterium]|nr:RNA methyltransferase [Flavobacteriales bacterium]